MKYPLLRRCFPGVETFNTETGETLLYASQLEAALEKAVMVYGDTNGGEGYAMFMRHDGDFRPPGHTHSALLLGIEPIVRDSAESLLKEMIRLIRFGHRVELDACADRAQLLLGEDK